MFKRCPFCSYESVKLVTYNNTAQIICDVCKARGPQIEAGDQFNDEEAEETALHRWNLRPLYQDVSDASN